MRCGLRENATYITKGACMPTPFAVNADRGATVARPQMSVSRTSECSCGAAAGRSRMLTLREAKRCNLDVAKQNSADGRELTVTHCFSFVFLLAARMLHVCSKAAWRGADISASHAPSPRCCPPAHAPKRDNIPNVCNVCCPR
jgi:hypothetical protein